MFVKLFNQILDSSIADDRRLRHFFIDILLCSDPQGFVMMTESAIARRIGTSVDEVKWGIAELMKPDPRSKTPDNEGRRLERVDGSGYGWRIINFEAYKLLKSAEDMREKTRERVRRFREKSKESEPCNADVTPCNAGNTTKRKNEEEEVEKEEEKKSVCVNNKVHTPTHTDSALIQKINSTHSAYKSPALSKSERDHMEANREYAKSIQDEDWRTIGQWMLARVDWKPKNRMQMIANIDQCHTYAIDWRRKNPIPKPKPKREEEQHDEPEMTPEEIATILNTKSHREKE